MTNATSDAFDPSSQVKIGRYLFSTTQPRG